MLVALGQLRMGSTARTCEFCKLLLPILSLPCLGHRSATAGDCCRPLASFLASQRIRTCTQKRDLLTLAGTHAQRARIHTHGWSLRHSLCSCFRRPSAMPLIRLHVERSSCRVGWAATATEQTVVGIASAAALPLLTTSLCLLFRRRHCGLRTRRRRAVLPRLLAVRCVRGDRDFGFQSLHTGARKIINQEESTT